MRVHRDRLADGSVMKLNTNAFVSSNTFIPGTATARSCASATAVTNGVTIMTRPGRGFQNAFMGLVLGLIQHWLVPSNAFS